MPFDHDPTIPIIVGSGLAALSAALTLAPRPVLVVTAGGAGEQAASGWAQGGLAAAIATGDSPELHAADTIAAGAGLCIPEVVEAVTRAAPEAAALLERHGVRFDRTADGSYKQKLEAAHAVPRVLNAGGDGTGAEIMRALVHATRNTPSIRWLEHTRAIDFLTDDVGIAGLIVEDATGHRGSLSSRQIILATGGCGGLWLETSNPKGALGHGLAMAARAGAPLVDLEFVQFHPTGLAVGRDPMPLVSEAVRGDGALLVDENGRNIMSNYARGALEPRDIVARAVFAELERGKTVFLDTRPALGDRVSHRFPTFARACSEAGIDPTRQPVPVRPCAHYHMGGVQVDRLGRTTIPGLWACGEVASTGLHGANRLASNSLLEAVVFGRIVAEDLSAADCPALPRQDSAEAGRTALQSSIASIRRLMSRHVGVIRRQDGLARAMAELAPLARAGDGAAQVAAMIATAAYRRRESRGGHFRSDHPTSDSALAARYSLTLSEALACADHVCAEAA